jgi:hypothetical protein
MTARFLRTGCCGQHDNFLATAAFSADAVFHRNPVELGLVSAEIQPAGRAG